MAWKNTDSDYTQGERWFLLYNYLIKNSSKKHPVSRKQIFDYFEKEYGLKVSLHTFYADIGVIRSEAFNLDVEYDKHLFGGAGGYYVRSIYLKPMNCALS